MLNSDSILECNFCGNDFSLNNQASGNAAPEQKVPKKHKIKKSIRSSRRPSAPAVTGRHRRASSHGPITSSEHTKMIVNLCVYGLGLILFSVLAFKLFGGKPQEETQAKMNQPVNNQAKDAYSESLKNEIADLRTQLKKSGNNTSTGTQGSGAQFVKHQNVGLVTKEADSNGSEIVHANDENDPDGNLTFQLSDDSIDDGNEDVSDDRNEANNSNASTDSDQVSNESTQDRSSKSTYVSHKAAKITRSTILIPSEQSELDQLSKIEQFELTDEEKYRLKELKNKYLWYKSNRFKMTREDMDHAWDKRWAEIVASNDMVRSRSDSLLPRPLQILLAQATSQKDRVYLMRIYQKPVSFEEKERVRRARSQAIWERRKKDGPSYFPEDRKKERNEKYIDDLGYEYYLNDKGQRVYF